MRIQFAVVMLLVVATACRVTAGDVRVTRESGRAGLLVAGKPFYVRGVTFGIPANDPQKLEAAFADLQQLGVNAIRNWGIGKDTKALLDAADRHGIKVCLGLWLRHGRSGAEGDDNFDWVNDEAGRQAQWDGALKAVREYKDHPALLMWGLGNEVILNIGSEAEKVAYAEFMGKLAAEIKRIDPHHPVTSAGAWSLPWPYWKKYCPALDIYGVNTYGAGVQILDKEQEKHGVTVPYMLTEYNVRGEWDAPKDRNGAKIEPTDQEKYDAIAKGWPEWIESKPNCLGGFVFHYSDADNFVGNWLCTRVMGHTRPAYWGIYKAFAGKEPLNDFPRIATFSLRNDVLAAGAWVPVDLQVTDREGEDLKIEFYCSQKSDNREESWAMRPLEARGSLAEGFEVQMPSRQGLIKIYAYVKDPYKNMASAQTSAILKTEGELARVDRPGKKMALPFYVYEDEGSPQNHYVPSGLMGEQSAMKIDYACAETPHRGPSCIRFRYTKADGWFGLVWQDPHNDWGDAYGGFDVSGATRFSFWARGEKGGEVITLGFGMISREKRWFDTAQAEHKDLVLEKDWKQYVIDLNGRDLTRIKTGCKLFIGAKGEPFTFYLDDIAYE